MKVLDSVSFGSSKGVIEKIVEDRFEYESMVIEGSKDAPIYMINLVEGHDLFKPTNKFVFKEAKDLTLDTFIVEKTVSQQWDLYQKGVGLQPEIKIATKIANDGEKIVAILSKEEVDRDGEIVDIRGVNYDHYKETGAPLIDAHNMGGSSIDDRIGTLTNIRRKEDQLMGDVNFAPTRKGLEAKAMHEAGHPMFISIGFRINDYNADSKTITKSELYEASVVNVPSNRSSMILSGKSVEVAEEAANETVKSLAHYEKIYPVFNEFTRLFFKKSLFKKLGIEKDADGNMIMDTNSLYDRILDILETKSVEAPLIQNKTNTIVEAPREVMSKTAIKENIKEIFTQGIKEGLNARNI